MLLGNLEHGARVRGRRREPERMFDNRRNR